MAEIKVDDENTQLIEEMLRTAEKAAEPGELEKNRVIHKGDEELPSPMVATQLESAGYVYIYDTETHEQSVTNRNMLLTQLKKKRPNGTVVFTTVKPKIKPARGKIKCLLHPDGPDREHYNVLGLAECLKCNITSPFQLGRHMKKRHKMERDTIEDERKEKEKAEDRAFQRELMRGKAAVDIPEVYKADHPYKPKRKKTTKLANDKK